MSNIYPGEKGPIPSTPPLIPPLSSPCEGEERGERRALSEAEGAPLGGRRGSSATALSVGC